MANCWKFTFDYSACVVLFAKYFYVWECHEKVDSNLDSDSGVFFRTSIIASVDFVLLTFNCTIISSVCERNANIYFVFKI